MNFAIISTFPVPHAAAKRPNIGDGFILASTKRALADHRCTYTKSYWEPVSEFDVDFFNRQDFVVLAAANQLSPDFALTRGTPAYTIDRIKVPIYIFGMGLHGEYASDAPFTVNARMSLERIVGKAGLASLRCRRSARYLQRQLPELADRFVYTNCPVLTHGGNPRTRLRNAVPESPRRILVTITDRGGMIGAELELITRLRAACPDADLVLALHQHLEGHGTWLERRRRRAYFASLHRLRCKLVEPRDPTSSLEMYRQFDAHVGSRLHAHLLFLSNGLPSLLLPVDQRAGGFADTLGFSPWQPQGPSPLEQLKSQRWDEIEAAVADARHSMNSFVELAFASQV